MMRSFRGQFRRVPALLTALVLLVGTLFPAQGALAAPTGSGTDTQFDLIEALTTLTDYGLVKGDQGGDLRLSDPITRAEMVTMLVRALGYEEQALFLSSAAPFPDVQGHWSAGYVMVAKNLGLAGGYPDGTFRPDQYLTYAESLALLLRLVKKQPTAGTWPDGVLTQAVMVGIAPPGVQLFPNANTNATRLDVFSSFYLSVTQVKDPSTGKTLLQTLDTVPPVLTLNALPEETDKDTITLSGQATGASKVTVAGKSVTLDKEGKFTATVSLRMGANAVEVQAADRAGNIASTKVSVERLAPVARLEISGPTQVQTGSSAVYAVKGYDASGKEVAVPDAALVMTGSAGSFSASTNTLTAGPNPGTVTLQASYAGVDASLTVQIVGLAKEASRLRVITSGSAPENTPTTVRVEVLDADGNPVSSDNGRTITLKADATNVVISPSTAKTVNGVATYEVVSGRSGTIALTATAAGLASDVAFLTVRSAISVKLDASPTTLAPGESARIRATLVNAAGQAIVNESGNDIRVRISVSGDGDLDTTTLTIPKGRSTSTGYDAQLTAGYSDTSLRVSGYVSSGQDYDVEEVSIRVTLASGSSGPAELRVLSPGTLAAGEEGLYIVQVKDSSGRDYTAQDVAFRLRISTSNNEKLVNGIPVDENGDPVLTLRFGDFDTDELNPTTTTVRTDRGTALVYVTYYRSGKVTLTPVGVSGGNKIPDDDGDEDSALRSSGLRMTEGSANYQGEFGSLQIKVKSPISNAWSTVGGLMRNSTTQRVTLRVEALDTEGRVIPGYDEDVTLTHLSGSATEIGSRSTVRATDGVAEFEVEATTTTGTDFYEATSDGHTSQTVQMVVQDNDSKTIETPIIDRIYGLEGSVEVEQNTVGPLDDYMRVYLVPQGEGLAAVKVYRGSSLVYTSGVIDISDAAPYVDVPRSSLPSSGSYEFRVQLVNAVGTSGYSAESETVALLGYNSAYMSSAAIDGTPGSEKLVITGRGFTSDGDVDVSKLSLVNPDKDDVSRTLVGATVESISSSSIVLDISGATADSYNATTDSMVADGIPDILQPQLFFGKNVYLSGEAGWYIDASGNLAKEDLSSNLVTPMPVVTSGEFDVATGKLYLNGRGFSSGTATTTTVKSVTLTDGTDTIDLGEADRTPTRVDVSDTRLIITLHPNHVDTFVTSFDTSDMSLEAGAGYVTKGSGKALPVSAPLYIRATVTSVSYDGSKLIINGSGFSTDGTVDPTLITITDLSSDATLTLSALPLAPTSSAKIEIPLTEGEQSSLNSSNFSGTDIYLLADSGWYTDGKGRQAAPVTEDSARRVSK